MVFAIGDNGDNAAVPEFSSERFTIIAFVHAEAFGPPPTFPNADAIHRFQNVDLVIAIRFTQCEMERVSVCIRNDVAFNA